MSKYKEKMWKFDVVDGIVLGRMANRISEKILSFCLTLAIVFLLILPVWGGDKEKDEGTLRNANKVLQEMVDSNSVPSDVLAKADCVIVLPDVKKMGFGIGGSGGRGPMLCRSGSNFEGKWSAPAMYTIGGLALVCRSVAHLRTLYSCLWIRRPWTLS